MKLKMTACIDVPKEKVWEILSDVSNIDLWVEPIQSACCEGNVIKGVGVIRVCNLKGNMTVRETFVQWDEGRYFTYEADETKYFKWARNRWSVESVNGKTLVTTESKVILKGGLLRKLFEPLMYLVSKKVGKDSLAALQYFAEEGLPYDGKLSKLPRVSIVC